MGSEEGRPLPSGGGSGKGLSPEKFFLRFLREINAFLCTFDRGISVFS